MSSGYPTLPIVVVIFWHFHGGYNSLTVGSASYLFSIRLGCSPSVECRATHLAGGPVLNEGGTKSVYFELLTDIPEEQVI